jgi:hypothetical protein
MRQFTHMLAAVAFPGLLGACAESFPKSVPPGRVELCQDGDAWQDELAALPATSVVKVEPTHWVDMCAGASQLSGTRLLIRRPETERLSHMLHCGRTRVRVGQAAGSHAEGHLQLPEGRMDIDVTREAGAYSVWLSAETVTKNLELLRRAKIAFVGHPRRPE